mgnify:CR=1 FL=1
MYRTVLRERRLPVDRTERASKRPLLLGGISNPGECDCALRGLLRALEGSRDPDRRDESADGDWGGGTDTVGARVDVGVPRDDDDGGGGGAAETEPWLRCANRDKKLLAAEGVSREPAPPTLLDTSTGSHAGTTNMGWGTQAGARARGHMVSKPATNVWVRQGETRTTAISHGAGFRRVSMRGQLGSTLDLCAAHTLPGKSLGTTRTDSLQRNTRGHRSSSTARTRGANRQAMQKAVVVGAG